MNDKNGQFSFIGSLSTGRAQILEVSKYNNEYHLNKNN